MGHAPAKYQSAAEDVRHLSASGERCDERGILVHAKAAGHAARAKIIAGDVLLFAGAGLIGAAVVWLIVDRALANDGDTTVTVGGGADPFGASGWLRVRF